MATSRYCPNCHEMQDFRRVNAKEKSYLQTLMTSAEANGFWRCRGAGGHCLWVQPHLNQDKGRTLPLSFI
ncbi:MULTISPECIES: hypothetical protein [unclassified Streptomyces]|uniref:hypothetical protein n=1 Tax=unclassified Streptomyces TaxID=2593676 RepID=UPI00278C1D6B|nr:MULTISPECIES: hypothetical protein [unclassified Streptomyces]